MPHDIFISHSSKDKTIADAACACLEARGLRCWIAPRDIIAGADWSASIIDGISGAKAMVLILSSHSNVSKQVVREIERAASRGIPVLPFRIEDVVLSKSLEYFLSSAHWIDAYHGPLKHSLEKLANNAAIIIDKQDAVRPLAEQPPPRGWRTPVLLASAATVTLLAALLGGMITSRPREDAPAPAQEPPRVPAAGADVTFSFSDGKSRDITSLGDGSKLIAERDAGGAVTAMDFKPGPDSFGLGIRIGLGEGADQDLTAAKVISGILVEDLVPGGPAARDAVLRKGDVITAVIERDGAEPTPLAGLFSADVSRLLHGRDGTSVRLSVQRDGSTEPIEIVATRGPILPVRNRAAEAHFVNSLGMEFIAVPGGVGLLGIQDHTDPTLAPHYVRISRGFLLGAHEVTQGEFAAVMSARPSVFSKGGAKAEDVASAHAKGAIPNPDTSHHPVDSVSWEEAVEFCRRLGEREGRTYRLPTEAEWEWACRNAGTIAWQGFWHPAGKGTDETAVGRNLDFPATPHPVGSRSPLDNGLHDMFGNVAEWCADVFAEDGFVNAAFVDPQGPSKGLKRVARGGAFKDNATAFFERAGIGPSEKRAYVGFRVVLEPTAGMVADRDLETSLLDTSRWEIDETAIPDPIPPVAEPKRTFEDEQQELAEISGIIERGGDLKALRSRLASTGSANQSAFVDMRLAWMQVNARLGDQKPSQSMALYNAAHKAKPTTGYGQLEQARLIDPLLGWVSNDIAWSLVTDPKPEHRDPAVGVVRAVEACTMAKWQYWGFLDTLAAALAAAGRQESALRVAKAALERAPESEREQLEHAIDRYGRGLAWAAKEP